MNAISGVYKITNTITNDFYIGSSKDIKKRLAAHKYKSTWNNHPNNPLYKDFQKYGVNKFDFQVLEEVEPEQLKEAEQQFIESLNPTYNSNNAKGLDIERKKEYNKEYRQSDKYKEYNKEYQKSEKFKEYQKEYQKKYNKSEKFKEYQKEYYKSEKGKESLKKSQNKYQSQLCFFNGEHITLCALRARFSRAGVEHPNIEAKKYLLK